MKITHIKIENILGLRYLDVALDRNILLVCGKNGSGKSSLREAVTMALTGDGSSRVELKKEYGRLVTDGAKDGSVRIDTSLGSSDYALPSGKLSWSISAPINQNALKSVLDASRFAWSMDQTDRRRFLFELVGLKANGEEIEKRLLARGIDQWRVDKIKPFLKSGFDAAAKEAEAKARESRACWKAETGEAYGEKKAADWKAERPEFDAAKLAQLEHDIENLTTGIDRDQREIGALEAESRIEREWQAKINGLKAKASLLDRCQTKYDRDVKDLEEYRVMVEEKRARAGQKREAYACAHCGGMLEIAKAGEIITGLIPHEPVPYDAAAAADLERMEPALAKLESAARNSLRDLEDAKAAAKELEQLEKGTRPSSSDQRIGELKDSIAEKKQRRIALSEELDGLKSARLRAELADKKTESAAVYHADVLAWGKVAEALSPEGIPAELLSAALGPFNSRLHKSAEATGWPCVAISSDMGVTYGGRLYSLCSESEQWRADAMIAEAIAHLSGLGVLMLDRMDVLDVPSRASLIVWLDELAYSGELDSAIVLGTLKALPTTVPDTIQTVWIENGTARIEEAKAA
jgi:energy-coupling factor transporter ATP-binding protein EcfA2